MKCASTVQPGLILVATSTQQRLQLAPDVLQNDRLALRQGMQAIVLHHLQGCSLIETARRLVRSDEAVAGLLHRGLKKLRKLLVAE